MDRRHFLQATVAGAAVSRGAAGGTTEAEAAPAPSPTPIRPEGGAPAVLATYAAADHRLRLENIAACNQAIRGSMRRHLVTNYLPGQCAYNLGEYPSVKPWNPDEYDERELDRLRDHGIRLIQLFDESNDALRLFGGHKLAPLNPEGLRRFVEMAHRRGIKVITYISTGYFQFKDPDLREEWFRPGDGLTVGYWDMVRCAPASPGWRAHLFPHVVRLLDDYGLDGLYDDWGYVPNARGRVATLAKDEVPAFEETPGHDGAASELIQLIYDEVHRRGGVFKLHCDFANLPQTAGARVYDYLWVGENMTDADGLREAVKNHRPYVVPCLDMSFTKVEDDDEPFLHAIPYLQFPLLQAGRPWTGQRARVPGVVYHGGENDWWVKRCRAIEQFLKEHPDGPYTYGGWDSVPGRAETRPTHARWLKRYQPLVEDGTHAWLEIADSNFFTEPLPKGVVASAFANRRLHLVLANYGREPVAVATTDRFVSDLAPDAEPSRDWRLEPRSLKILRRAAREG